MARLPSLVAGLFIGWALSLLVLAARSMSVVVAELACGFLLDLHAAPSRGAFVTFWVVSSFL